MALLLLDLYLPLRDPWALVDENKETTEIERWCVVPITGSQSVHPRAHVTAIKSWVHKCFNLTRYQGNHT